MARQTWFELLRVRLYIKNDLKGKENCLELAGGSSYRGFEFLRVKLQKMYHGFPKEIDFDSS